jgi:AraC-like DNA-binding protein
MRLVRYTRFQGYGAPRLRRIIALLSLLPLLVSCRNDVVSPAGTIGLEGKWKIIATDSAKAASPEYDDSGAPETTIPGDWVDTLKKNDNLLATVWIRKRVHIGREWEGKKLVLSLGRIGIADETWVNGVRIGLSGIIPEAGSPLYYHNSWQIPRRYYVPETAIRYGGENIIAIRIFSHVISGVSGDTVLGDHSEHYFYQFYNSYRSLIINVASLVLNALLLFVFLLLFISERRKTEYLYFSLLILFTTICNVITIESPLIINGFIRFKLFLFFYVLTNFFVFHGVKKFLANENRPAVYVSVALVAAVELLVLAAPSTRSLIYYGGFVSLVFINACIVASAVLFAVAVKKDPRRYWYFLVIAVPITVSVMRNSWYLFSFRFNELPLTIFMHVPLVFALITMYYIFDFERSRKERDALYTALLKKSQNIQRMLHSVKSANKKPEPRDIINSVIEYLDANYAEKYDRIELSKKFGLNEDYMGQVFKKVTGVNISGYINTNRINAAKDLLADTGAKIIDVAYHVGFDNLTHFHRQFKKQTGCTPNEYRTIIKKDSAG